MKDLSRRDALTLLAAATAGAACSKAAPEPSGTRSESAPAIDAAIEPLRPPPWKTIDPFLFCVHHDDAYPPGNAELGPRASLLGRSLGSDFAGKDGWRMYHGRIVPGFPQHPHRGFETVTVVRRGLLDHSDSLGATARYGQGDVQWLTAGRGILHAEMFPLLKEQADNPLELFQIWLNLPATRKMVEPHFTMLWSPTVPRIEREDDQGRRTTIALHAGAFEDVRPPAPPPRSYAAMEESDLAIWTLVMQAGARLRLPAARPGTLRTLYFFRGRSLIVGGHSLASRHQITVKDGTAALELINGDSDAEILLLQGRPIGEPIVKHGPFVMNTREEIERAYADYRSTQFGGWPWDRSDPVHPRGEGRFARHADGKLEMPPV
ncbi:MAG: pirin family protein [Polyangiaceae bacterium]